MYASSIAPAAATVSSIPSELIVGERDVELEVGRRFTETPRVALVQKRHEVVGAQRSYTPSPYRNP